MSKISKEFIEYINFLVEEISLLGMPFSNKKKYLKKYADAEGLDYNNVEKGIEELLITLQKGNIAKIYEISASIYLTQDTIAKLILPIELKDDKNNFMFRLLDIGGSGVKTTKINSNFDEQDLANLNVTEIHKPEWSNFAEWVYMNGLLDCDSVGISTAGFVNSNGIIELFRVGNWKNKDLVKELKMISNKTLFFLLNDAEAHLISHTNLYTSPIMSISIGTSIGFSISDKNGSVVKALNGCNFDIGEMAIPTSASNKRAWYALGSLGLSELINDLGDKKGKVHFGHRIGAFLVTLSSIFRPSTIVLSGGITELYWDEFKESMFTEFNFNRPDWLNNVEIVKSPYCKNAALIGIAKYTKSMIYK